MNIWRILEIEPTDDKKKIKSAYRAKLREVNPESQPEAFMELREAYEKALKELETGNKKDVAGDKVSEDTLNTENGNPIEQWKAKLTGLYQDNTRRFQTEPWEELFQDDVCYSLDTRDEAGKEFLAFFYEHPFISQKVLLMAEEAFHFTEKEEELMEDFPYELVDIFINYKLRDEEFPQYTYFAQDPLPDADYDEYIRNFHGFCTAQEEDDRKKAARYLKKLDETGIRHPSVEVKRAWLYQENPQKFEEIMRDIEETWGEHDEAVFLRGECLLNQEQPEEAEKYFRRTLEINPDYENAKVLLVVSLRMQKRYMEARDFVMDAEAPDLRMRLLGFLNDMENEMLQVYEEKLQQGTITEEEISCLSVAYYRKERLDDAQKTMELLAGKAEWICKYLRMRALILEKKREWERALSITNELIEELEKKEDSREKRNYLAEAYMMRGRLKIQIKQKEDGLEDIDQAVALSSNQEDYLLQKASLLVHFRLYELAVDVLSQLLEKNPRNSMYRYGRGLSYFRLGALQDAYEDFEYLCIIDENNLEAHIYRMKIYLEAEATEAIEETFQFFKEKGFDTDSVRLLKGIYQEYSGNYKEARKIFEDLIKNYDLENSDLESIGEVYLHLVQVDIGEDKRGAAVFRHLAQGLKKDPEYIPLLEKRWELNEAFDDEEDVEKDVKEILRLAPYHAAANAKMSDIYEKAGQMEKANEYLNMQQQAGESQEVYINKAFNKIICGELDAAWEQIALAEAMDDETMVLHRIKALYYSVVGENEKAIELYTLVNQEDDEEDYYEEIAHCYCHMGEFDKARKQLREIFEKGDKERACLLLFELELEQGHYEQAEKALKQWQKSRKKLFKDDAYRAKAGKLLVGKHEYKKAKEVFDAAEVNEYVAREYSGSLNLYEGKAKKALKYFLSGIKEWPDNLELYYYAALANLILGNHKEVEKFAREGLRQLEQDREIGAKLKDIYKEKGAFYSLLGEFDKAQMCFEEALKSPMCTYCMSCQCHEIHTKMAVMYHLMGEEEKCREALAYAGKIKPDDIDFVGLSNLLDKKAF